VVKDKSDEIQKDINVRIYPNPTNGIINLDIDGRIINPAISITDLSGKEVYKERINITGQRSIDISFLKKGFYIVRVKDDKSFTSKKIVVY
jgi:hypothetical protein